MTDIMTSVETVNRLRSIVILFVSVCFVDRGLMLT